MLFVRKFPGEISTPGIEDKVTFKGLTLEQLDK